MKKAKGKGKGTETKAPKKSRAKKRPAKTMAPKDFVQVRKSIAAMVREAAEEIVTGVIEKAKSGQLAQAKYLFEAVGLYPPTAETMTPAPEDSLAFTLLKRMGLPTEPVICEEYPLVSVTSAAKPATRGAGGIEENCDSEGRLDEKPHECKSEG